MARNRTERVNVRLSPAERRLLDRAAERVGEPPTTFARNAALEVARQLDEAADTSKRAVVDRLLSHPQNAFTREELEAKDLEELRKLDKMAAASRGYHDSVATDGVFEVYGDRARDQGDS